MQVATFNDRLFGVPLYADVSALFYNKDLFKAAGAKLDADAMKAIDDTPCAVVMRDPAMTLANAPRTRVV